MINNHYIRTREFMEMKYLVIDTRYYMIKFHLSLSEKISLHRQELRETN